MDFYDFGNEAPTGPTFEMHDDIHGITDICFDCTIRQVNPALEDTACESGKSLFGRRRMNSGKTAGVSCVQKLQEIEGLPSTDLSELRGEYICSWCEMNGGYLSAIPHPNSKCEVRRFSYPREAEIVGRVVGVTMRLADTG